MTNQAIGLNNYATGENSRYPELWRGCVGAWAMCMGPTGTRLFDFSGRQNWGTLTNMDAATDWVVSGGQYALDFDGSNDEVTFGNISQLDTASSLTVSLFYRPVNTSNLSGIVKQWKVTSPQSGVYLFQNGAALSWQVGNSLNTRLTTGSVLTANTWHSIVCTKTTSSMEVFVNGVSVASVAAAGSNDSGSQAFNLGSNLGGLDFAIAQMDDVRVYNRALTEAEIKLLASKRGIGLQPSPTRFIARQKQTGLRRKILTGQT